MKRSFGFQCVSTGPRRERRAPSAEARTREAMYEGRATVVILDDGATPTEYLEAFCLWLAEKHGVKARPGKKPRFTVAWTEDRVRALFDAWAEEGF